MNTRKILIVSSDKDLTGIIKISALTLTKLNCQVSVEETSEFESAAEMSRAVNLDLIIIDNDFDKKETVNLISRIRQNINSKTKKIICLYTGAINREEIFKAGCDSIMTKDEFKRVVNNVLVF
jgi:DNA-binding response OmpR family regulator